ncbi:MAG: thiolase family protein [candidate division KSB1 bacterium]|nr:thiolase family protein [candidate division KSB1 bacterium]MDZ7275109.1 thiolase family protein [candidate division KSB1 bacterium]MDZ7286443.1 thiolase family protein [candidate division KSB1 bacterium]MDZ7299393.1 thiolase family protein [candidate division KSB1 bacterium]MDZ7307829.1 thiolase family protein [candidate division KSB1 bacterium]
MSTPFREVVIAGACRTPIGAFQGALAPLTATELGALVVKEAVQRAGLDPKQVDEVIMGCVLPAGVGQAPARQAAIKAGLPVEVTCMTINKVCGSGLKAVMLAAQAIMVGEADIVVAGGMESMSNAPYLLSKARDGYRLGHGELIDSMIKDGLWDVYNNFHMGNAAELCARECHIPRARQDEFAMTSYRRAQAAQANGLFRREIVAVPLPQKKGDPVLISEDEEPPKANFEKMAALRPAFDKEGTVTAANASKINDGAAAVVVMAKDVADRLGVKAQAKLLGQAAAAKKPEWFTTAPVDAINRLLKKSGFTLPQVDLFEINEAFAVVALAAQQQLGIPMEKLNVHGGAVALGHPIGASGCRILVTLIHALQEYKKRYGLAAICIGGGEAVAVLVENAA